MRAHGRTSRWLWRWRANPLRRHDDVLEAWLVLAVWLIVAVGGTFAGFMAARSAADVFARQRAERAPVQAVLLTDAPRASQTYRRALVTVRWTPAGGPARTGTALVDAGRTAGSHVVVWTNTRGDLTTEPPGPTESLAEAVLFGAGAALAVTGLGLGAGAAGRCLLDRRRVESWGREWDQLAPH
ncbi:Rv1733c family protein [Streptomyces sp. NPDC002144]